MSKKPLPHFACYPGDFFSDPRFNRQTGEVRGTWCQLVLLMWHEGNRTRLPDDDNEISYYLNITPEIWKAHRVILEEAKLLSVDAQMRQVYSNRLEREFGIAEGKCKQNAENRKKGWEKEKNESC